MIATIDTRANKGFTLIELLVVIAIIGVLAAVVLLAINPAELLRRSRDSGRLQDLSTLRKAVDSAIAQQTGAITLPCTTACLSNDGRGRSAAGTGWLGASGGTFDLTQFLSTLPIDPINASTTVACNGGTGCTTSRLTAVAAYSFRSAADATYELNTYLESTQNLTKLNGDGGNSDNIFETGTAPGLTLI